VLLLPCEFASLPFGTACMRMCLPVARTTIARLSNAPPLPHPSYSPPPAPCTAIPPHPTPCNGHCVASTVRGPAVMRATGTLRCSPPPPSPPHINEQELDDAA
jgi:hypothetical protein